MAHRYQYQHSSALLYFLLSLIPTTSSLINTSNSNATLTKTFKRATNLNETLDDATTRKSSDIPADFKDDLTIAHWVNQLCIGCPNEPDLSQVKDRTYTAIWIPRGNQFQYNLTFDFLGSAVYVYVILSNQGSTECDFILDGQKAQQISMSTEEPYHYNELAFSKEGLEERMHELVISTRGRPDQATYLNLDYAEYTRLSQPNTSDRNTSITTTISPEPSSTEPSNRHLTVKSVAGGVVGGFIAVILLFIIFYYRRRKKRRQLEKRVVPFSGVGIGGGQGYSQVQTDRHSQSYSQSRTSGVLSDEYHSLGIYPNSRSGNENGNGTGRGRGNVGIGGIIPYTDPHNSSSTSTTRDQIRQERQRELNSRLQNATLEMRDLKQAYNQGRNRYQQEHRHLEQQHHRQVSEQLLLRPPSQQPQLNSNSNSQSHSQRQHLYPPSEKHSRHTHSNSHSHTHSPSDPTFSHINTNPNIDTIDDLADMRQQMQLMMDQIQTLRAEQNSAYIQGLTDEPPPGYAQVMGSQC